MRDAAGGRTRRDDEVELVEVLAALGRRRWFLLTTVALVLAASVGFALVAEPKYEASVRVLPLEHAEVVEQWLRSREAARWIVAGATGALKEALLPEAWDEAASAWRVGSEPSIETLAMRLQDATVVRVGLTERGVDAPVVLTVRVTLPGPPEAARDAALAYVRSLEALRPSLEALTAQEAFARHFDGSNEEEARRLGEATARARTYWLSFDGPATPREPSSPSVPLVAALGLLVGLVGGTLLALLVDRVSSTPRVPVRTARGARERGAAPEPARPPDAP